MRIEKEEHVGYLKKKVAELNRKYLHELKQGKSSLQYLRDICFVITTLTREIFTLEKDLHTRENRFSKN